MAEIGGFAQAFAGALAEVAPVLDERARRLLMGAAARQLGRGGITLIAAATGASKDTVGRGAGELEAGVVVDGRVRATGAGRKSGHPPKAWRPPIDGSWSWARSSSLVPAAGWRGAARSRGQRWPQATRRAWR